MRYRSVSTTQEKLPVRLTAQNGCHWFCMVAILVVQTCLDILTSSDQQGNWPSRRVSQVSYQHTGYPEKLYNYRKKVTPGDTQRAAARDRVQESNKELKCDKQTMASVVQPKSGHATVCFILPDRTRSLGIQDPKSFVVPTISTTLLQLNYIDCYRAVSTYLVLPLTCFLRETPFQKLPRRNCQALHFISNGFSTCLNQVALGLSLYLQRQVVTPFWHGVILWTAPLVLQHFLRITFDQPSVRLLVKYICRGLCFPCRVIITSGQLCDKNGSVSYISVIVKAK